MPLEELDKVLQQFYAELVKNYGTDYEPVTESDDSMLRRNLREHGKP